MIMTITSDRVCGPSRVEVLTSVERRRRWSTPEKVRLVEESMQPGLSV
jgi:transposase